MGDYTYDEKRQEKASKPEYWWRSKKQGRTKDVHECVFSVVRFLEEHQGYKHDDNLRRVRLYGNLPVFGLSPQTFAVDPSRKGRPRLNLIRSVIDTGVARIAKERPRPSPVTDGADYRLKKHAKLLEKYILGVLQQNDVYKSGPAVFRDSALAGTGIFHGWIDWQAKRVRIERVFPDELLFDDAEACSGALPRQLHRRKYLAKEVAIGIWGTNEDGTENANAKKIRDAAEPKPKSGMGQYRNLTDMIEVVASWHLPSGENSKDGRHSICIENATLVEEPYDCDTFPFVFQVWGDPIMGLLGMGVADQITGIQVALNKHMDAMEEELGLAAARILVPSNSDIPKSHWVNRIGAVLTYTSGSEPPQVLNPDMVPPGRREQIMFLIEQAYEMSGINRLSATGHKPAGLNSGAAQREYQDIQAERFAVIQRAYEHLYVDLAWLILRLSRELYAEHKDLTVTVRQKQFLERIEFGAIDLKDEQFDMDIFPTSMLPKTPAARFAQIDEWVQAGYLSKEEGMNLMDMPDLEDATTLITAAIEDIDNTIDRFLYDEPDEEDMGEAAKGEKEGTEEWEQAIADYIYVPPDGLQNLQLGMKRMLAAYLRAKHDGTPEARRMLLERWISDAKAMAPQPQPAPAPGATPPGMPPPGAPVPPGAAPMPPV